MNGANPWDLVVHDERFYDRLVRNGSLGLGESYMDGWWDCDALDEMIARLVRSDVEREVGSILRFLPAFLKAVFVNLQSASRAFQVGRVHYDIGNDLYQMMLDKRMVYSCGYWKDASVLDDAQEAKLDLTCRKLYMEPGSRLLDIGCGWGSLVAFAAERYGVSCVGMTISEKQKILADEQCRGLPIEIRLQDYRRLNEPFDRIASLGMFEHVGYKNYRTYMQVVERCLADDGLFLLHTIGSSSAPRHMNEPWLERYIFPNSYIPSLSQIMQATEGRFVLEDLHNFGQYYDPTLMAWYHNVARHQKEIEEKYGQRFYRMWTYYLQSCAGLFRSRKMQLWQMVFSKKGRRGGYTSVR